MAPVAAQQLQNAVFYLPPAGMTLTEGTPTNGLMLKVSTRLDAKYLRQVVRYETSERSGVLVVDTQNHFLYFTLGGGKALRYGIGVAARRVRVERDAPDHRARRNGRAGRRRRKC